jgi:putative Mn2+ efflux pump MntP
MNKPDCINFIVKVDKIIALSVLICLGTFLITIPLPRSDNLLIGSDGIGYYAYLPSIWLDGDLDFSNQFATFYPLHGNAEDAFYNQKTPMGVPPNKWSVGPALLWTPFFLLAHGLAMGLQFAGVPIQADGYSYLYQAVVLSGSIIYGGMGIWFAFCFVRHWIQERAALVGVLLTFLGGNLIYYMTVEPSMSHPVSAFASGLFCIIWLKWRHQPSMLLSLLLGMQAGLMALIRPQDGLFLVLPFLDKAMLVIKDNRINPQLIIEYFSSVFTAILAAFVMFGVQLSVWYFVYGGFFVSGYAYNEENFNWLEPDLVEMLLFPENGLLLWHPVFLFSLLGLAYFWRIDRRMAMLGFIAIATQWYLIASWGTQGDSFGGRMFIVCTPIFALGLASLIEIVQHRWGWRPIALVSVLLLSSNFLLFVQYRFHLVMHPGEVTLYDLTLGRFVKPIELLLHYAAR